MYPSLARRPKPRLAAVPVTFAIAIPVAAWFLLLAIATPFDHDESQYIAAAWLSARGLMIFRDFLYLQPPLHAWAYMPVVWLFQDDSIVMMRLVTAFTALGTMAMLWAAQRVAGVSRDSAIAATLLAASAAAFQFTAAVVRNDMLPTFLSAIGMLAAFVAIRRCSPRWWIGAGVAFGLAISAKLNFAPLALASGLFVLTRGGRCGLKAALWLAMGGLAGMVPTIIAWMAGPDAFFYGVFTYGGTAPHAWYAANDAGHELGLSEKLADLLKFLSKGPALVILLLIVGDAVAYRRHVRSPGRSMALWMAIGALAGAALPTPSQLQYVMPLLPPLTLSLGYMLDDARRWALPWRRMLTAILVLAALPGMVKASGHMADMAREGSPILRAQANARWVDMQLSDAGDDRVVATLSPQMLEYRLPIDPRLATGPFAYRTGWTVKPGDARRFPMMTATTLRDLDAAPPAAILTGYEGGTRKLPLRPDDGLIDYARLRRYRPVAMPDGVGTLYLRPTNRVSEGLRRSGR